MLTVKNPVRDEDASQWLRNKSETELWALVQHGNPQEIIPYSIALTSQLNQVLCWNNYPCQGGYVLSCVYLFVGWLVCQQDYADLADVFLR